MEVVAIGEIDRKSQKLDIVATGETDLEARGGTCGSCFVSVERLLELGALVVVEGGKWRSSGRLERSKETDGRE